ncbi:DUF4861 domain-containing protein [Dysgonomonas sp. 216]|uniref:DUF4861 domain-containing protein n=1 Tax=Dysgonomonas sp. 216 TaxID=2302934 RepID=UPI0013D59EFE|nr:DUF4861 domain-containing protein [Dysgonomonas sp. 216]NDW18848.1 DUF4861 domain-containing protein [Dysgonomonas sp. 216]
MRKYFALFAVAALLASCAPKEMKITVENPSDFDRTVEMVEVPVDAIKAKVDLAEGQVYQVVNQAGEIIPSQVTFDGKLIFQGNLKAGETGTFTIKAGAIETFEAKTFGRFIQERKDDFAWENDRVAFRAYGPSLIASDGPSNGFDAWFKRTNALIIDKWYKDDLAGKASYHEDHGEGLDDYKVGRTLGAGAMAPYVNDSLWLNENYASQEVLENGPLRTTFKLVYKDITVDGQTYSESRTISIDAGSQLSKVVQSYGNLKTPIAVAAGLVKRENDSIIVSAAKDYIVYAEPKSSKADNIYLALVFPENFDKDVIDTYAIMNPKTQKPDLYSHVLAVATYQPDSPVTYYTGYGWSKFGFPTLNDFEVYTSNFAKALKQPLAVKY